MGSLCYYSIILFYVSINISLLIQSSYSTKLLVTTGYPYENGSHSEMINLANPNVTCSSPPNYTIKVERAFSGLINLFGTLHNFTLPLICGGMYRNYSNSDYYEGQTDCYILGDDKIVAQLLQPRSAGASVVLNNNILWITGGLVKSMHYTKTTEFVRLNQPTIQGPELPEPFWYHCMTKYSEDEIIIIGGDGPKTKTIMVDVPNGFVMNEGPPLIHYRLGHACETFQLDGRTMVIVVGGLAGRYSNVTEIWDPMSQFGWQEGPTLFTTCSEANLVKSPDGKGVILFGCVENTGAFYELVYSDGQFSWKEMQQRLKYPRFCPVSALVPDKMANCDNYNPITTTTTSSSSSPTSTPTSTPTSSPTSTLTTTLVTSTSRINATSNVKIIGITFYICTIIQRFFI